MIGVRFSNYISSILIVIDLAVALNSDGSCTSIEFYTEPVTSIQTYKTSVPFSKKCSIFSTRICYEYRDRINYKQVVHNIPKTRIKKQCCQGYSLKESNCVPVCSVSCVNGNCISPDNCVCNTGYHSNDEGNCIKNECDPETPQSNECLNGICTSNGVCLCNEGFVKKISSPNCVCKGGFALDEESKQCIPTCDEKCVNSDCSSPNICTCWTGFSQINSTHCEIPCENCTFGYCDVANVCQCNKGFVKDVLSLSCVCNGGFEFNEESKQCIPTCDEECGNSDCSSPNICTCWTGFSQINSTHCEIPCENCTNGYCEVANVCQCDNGYHMHNEDGKCVQNECSPNIMEDSCENGYCSNDGICLCNSGYEKNISMACTPICSLECVNGFCSEPEVCQCFDGYDLSVKNGTDEGSNCTNFISWNLCVAICDDCRYGTCIEGACNCFDGYVLHPRNRGKCILPEELVQLNLKSSTSTPFHFWVIIVVVSLGIVLAATGGFAYWRYVRENSYVCNSVAEVIYRKK